MPRKSSTKSNPSTPRVPSVSGTDFWTSPIGQPVVPAKAPASATPRPTRQAAAAAAATPSDPVLTWPATNQAVTPAWIWWWMAIASVVVAIDCLYVLGIYYKVRAHGGPGGRACVHSPGRPRQGWVCELCW